jgi:hypothetical protein
MTLCKGRIVQSIEPWVSSNLSGFFLLLDGRQTLPLTLTLLVGLYEILAYPMHSMPSIAWRNFLPLLKYSDLVLWGSGRRVTIIAFTVKSD